VAPDTANPSDEEPTLWPTSAQIEARCAQLNLADEFDAIGSPYSELDSDGQIVTRNLPAKPPGPGTAAPSH
jgi:hypothetical protein